MRRVGGLAASPPVRYNVEVAGGNNDRGHLHFDSSISPVVVTEFDVATYGEQARGPLEVPESGITIDGRTARDLTYLWRLDVATLDEMRSLLISWTGNEARITAFLATWAYERYWLAQATGDLLAAAGRPHHTDEVRTGLRQILAQRLLTLTSPIVGTVVGEPVTAGHMAKMAVNEGALHAAFDGLRRRVRGSAAEVLAEIVDRRGPMVDFFRREAAARIPRSTAERLSARIALAPPWYPLRAPGSTDAERVSAIGSIMSDPLTLAAVARSDGTVADLVPGHPTPTLDVAYRARRRRRAHPRPQGNRHGI